jgi:hypothetical protein
MVETLLLTTLGGLLGLLVGASGIRLLEVLGADGLPLGARIAFDGRLAATGVAGAIVLCLVGFDLFIRVCGVGGVVGQGRGGVVGLFDR